MSQDNRDPTNDRDRFGVMQGEAVRDVQVWCTSSIMHDGAE